MSEHTVELDGIACLEARNALRNMASDTEYDTAGEFERLSDVFDSACEAFGHYHGTVTTEALVAMIVALEQESQRLSAKDMPANAKSYRELADELRSEIPDA